MQSFANVHSGALIIRRALVSCHLEINSVFLPLVLPVAGFEILSSKISILEYPLSDRSDLWSYMQIHQSSCFQYVNG